MKTYDATRGYFYSSTKYDPSWAYAIVQAARQRDSEPCQVCGGDRLRQDFTGSGRCHAARPVDLGQAIRAGDKTIPSEGEGTQQLTTQGENVNVRTQAVQVLRGYVGQVLVDSVIVWQSEPKKTYAGAMDKAQRHLQEQFAKLMDAEI